MSKEDFKKRILAAVVRGNSEYLDNAQLRQQRFEDWMRDGAQGNSPDQVPDLNSFIADEVMKELEAVALQPA